MFTAVNSRIMFYLKCCTNNVSAKDFYTLFLMIFNIFVYLFSVLCRFLFSTHKTVILVSLAKRNTHAKKLMIKRFIYENCTQ